MKSQRYRKIVKENRKSEKESPYNFCDQWCERCAYSKQIRCRLYLDSLEQRITCIAHGKEDDDPEITGAVMEAQYKEIEEAFENMEELDEEQPVDFEDLPEDIQEHIRFVDNHPLPLTVERYRKCDEAFLKDTFYNKEKIDPKDKYRFETISRYYTLLSAKLERALAGFHEPVCENEFGLYDAIAQFAICRKAIYESLKALRNIKSSHQDKQMQITKLLALLNNICSRIKAIEESV